MEVGLVTEHTEQGWWQDCLERLALEVPPQQFGAWLKPMRVQVAPEADRVSLQVPNRIALDYIRSRYVHRITQLLREISGRELMVELSLIPRVARSDHGASSGAAAAAAALARVRPVMSRAAVAQPVQQILPAVEDWAATAEAAMAALANESQGQGRPGQGPGHAAGEAPRAASAAPAPMPTRLNPALTFETLIEGAANRMARAAALHVAHQPGQLYNPLFIYGGVGLGKTHLMHAVGNQMLADRPEAKVLYIHAEQFVTDVVKSYQRKTFDEFKLRYHSLDLLLIDDVQFIAGKERTQEEFFNAFEALLSKKSHIVMTSDTYPKGLTDIHERLVSRFDAGLTVAIEPPELEMRVAILINKARSEGTTLSEDVAFFVAKNVRSNVRELEGALRKVLAYARFNNKEVSIPVAREALRDLLSIQNRQISVENIQKTVADFYKIKVADMYSKKRPASIARPRQIAMYLSKELTQKSLPEIGELFGGRDHTTVLHAVRKIGQERGTNTELNQQLHVLEQTLKR
ncbi:chromosomal replication initiator protein DnaA [Corticibacter populi]|uniref:Chromosomal replication initiator protein DnaA n=1 Tax=Corticibacter populi TaxID=1550736 RepID=A0A3M6QMN1_9BURK|nr:chromosomal replication initiator protein DnaA [Corticibacter populi]